MKYFVPLTLLGMGLCILLSPTGKVPRTALAFGEYKYLVGGAFTLLGGFLMYSVYRHKKP